MPAAKISTVIPLFNGETYIARALDSVLSQRYANFEIIIIDDGSTDQSVAQIGKYLGDARVKYLSQENAGVAAARNTGIRHATGEYIAFLDQDDLWLPDKLALQVAYMEQHPEVALVHSDMAFIDGIGSTLDAPDWAWVQETYGHCMRELFMGNSIATLTALVRRTCLDAVGLLRQVLAPADDWDLWLRLAARYPFGFIPEVTGCYRVHAGNESRKLVQMLLAETRVVETFLAEHAEAEEIIGRQLIRGKLFSLYRDTAALLAREKANGAARQFWLKAVKQSPLAFEPYAGLVWNSLTPRSREALAWYKHKLSARLHRG